MIVHVFAPEGSINPSMALVGVGPVDASEGYLGARTAATCLSSNKGWKEKTKTRC